MNYCPLCGTPSYNNNSKFCTNCGSALPNNNFNNNNNQTMNNNYNYSSQPIVEDKNTFWWGVLGFFVPVAGLIIFLIWLHERPKSARSAGIGALIRTIITLVLVVLFFIFAIIMSLEEKDGENNYRSRYPYSEIFEEWT